ncbi:unnamed protein product, partial [Sphacelaria rigidula]
SVGAFCREADDVGDVGGVENTRQDEDSPVANTIPNLRLSLATLSVSHAGRPAPGVSSALATFTARTTAEYEALANISDAGSAHQPVLINNE